MKRLIIATICLPWIFTFFILMFVMSAFILIIRLIEVLTREKKHSSNIIKKMTPYTEWHAKKLDKIYFPKPEELHEYHR